MNILLVTDQSLLIESFKNYELIVMEGQGHFLFLSWEEWLEEKAEKLSFEAVILDGEGETSYHLEKEVPLFIMKRNFESEEAVRGVFSSDMSMRRMLERLFVSVRVSTLSRAEEQIISYLLQGESNKEIAYQLDMALTTTKYHMRNICQKLGAKNRTHAALMAQKLL